jgi:hypothetical protein
MLKALVTEGLVTAGLTSDLRVCWRVQGDTFQPGVFVDYVEPFKNKAREHRFVVRNFTYDPNAAQVRVSRSMLW